MREKFWPFQEVYSNSQDKYNAHLRENTRLPTWECPRNEGGDKGKFKCGYDNIHATDNREGFPQNRNTNCRFCRFHSDAKLPLVTWCPLANHIVVEVSANYEPTSFTRLFFQNYRVSSGNFPAKGFKYRYSQFCNTQINSRIWGN